MIRHSGALTGIILAAGLAAASGATPAAAQEVGGDKVNTLIIYGDDECPESSSDQITVCARLDESERFRIPERLRQSESPENTAWAQKVRSFETVGNFGPLSCSAVGAGGELGCTAAMIEAAYAERAQGSDVRFAELIAAAREERLSTIDEEAAETQARVEVIEEEYLERLRRESAGEIAPADDSAARQEPQVVNPADLAEPPSGL